MTFCTECGTDVTGFKFCGSCGTKTKSTVDIASEAKLSSSSVETTKPLAPQAAQAPPQAAQAIAVKSTSIDKNIDSPPQTGGFQVDSCSAFCRYPWKEEYDQQDALSISCWVKKSGDAYA